MFRFAENKGKSRNLAGIGTIRTTNNHYIATVVGCWTLKFEPQYQDSLTKDIKQGDVIAWWESYKAQNSL